MDPLHFCMQAQEQDLESYTFPVLDHDDRDTLMVIWLLVYLCH